MRQVAGYVGGTHAASPEIHSLGVADAGISRIGICPVYATYTQASSFQPTEEDKQPGLGW